MRDPKNTILLLHPPAVDPRPFLTRLIGLLSPTPEDESTIPWRIDNKYYTADVNYQFNPISGGDEVQASGVPVIIYLFDQATLSPIPTGLVRVVVSEPRDIAFAIHVRDDRERNGNGHGSAGWQEMEAVFEELGMEVIDEAALAEDDDERPMSPLEEVRQMLMTHLWPSMIRKSVSGPPAETLDSDEEWREDEDDAEEGARNSVFPVTFVPSTTMLPKEGAATDFPGLDELRRHLPQEEMRGDEEIRLGDDEYARLDEWLDEDGDDGHGHEGFMALPEDDNADDIIDVPEGSTSRSPKSAAAPDGGIGFEDDFDDFAPFQAAPPRTPRGDADGLLSMDPTPLLLHLQSVRTELAGVEDEDERRRRAGREVERVMRGIGMGMGIGMGDVEFGRDGDVDEDGDGLDRLGAFDEGALGGLGGL